MSLDLNIGRTHTNTGIEIGGQTEANGSRSIENPVVNQEEQREIVNSIENPIVNQEEQREEIVNSSTNVNRIQCAICLENFHRPIKSLKCGHSFCYRCLIPLQRPASATIRRTIVCPICRHITMIPRAGLRRLPTNVVLEQILADSGNLNDEQVDDDLGDRSSSTSPGIIPISVSSYSTTVYHQRSHTPNFVHVYTNVNSLSPRINRSMDDTDNTFDGFTDARRDASSDSDRPSFAMTI